MSSNRGWKAWLFGWRTHADRQVTDRPTKRKPFSSLMKRITNFNKSSDQQEGGKNKKGGIPLTNSKQKKGSLRNNPYPESGPLQKRELSPASSANGQLSFASRPQDDSGSYTSDPNSASQGNEGQSNSNRSGAPTLATNPETVHSDAGHSKAATATTNGGALSSIDGAGAGSTFSSPNQSDHSLTTTLTTIQSQSPGNALGPGVSGHHHNSLHGNTNNTNPVMFSHQYPTSPAPSHMTASAIPRHVASTLPNTYNSATADNLLTDNASILTLASSSKRRRRSMDTDASVRALAPSSVWGGSRESLPLSVLSGNTADAPSGLYAASQSRPTGGLASAERASMYSNQGVAAPALASERNSFYSHKPTKGDLADAKSLRSITNIDARSQFDGRSAYDARSINDAKSMHDVSSLRGYEGSVRSGAIGHGRNDSIPGSIGSPLASPGLSGRHANTSGALSRRSTEWHEAREDAEDVDDDETTRQGFKAEDNVVEHEK